jgi:hypothetical protein
VEKEQPYRRALVCFQCDEQLRMVKKKKKRGWDGGQWVSRTTVRLLVAELVRWSTYGTG